MKKPSSESTLAFGLVEDSKVEAELSVILLATHPQQPPYTASTSCNTDKELHRFTWQNNANKPLLRFP